MSINQLTALGLPENEAKTYAALLKTKDATAQELARTTGLSRTLTYYVVDQLKKRGLVDEVARGRKTAFAAAPPARLHDMLKSEAAALEAKQAALAHTVAALDGQYRLAHAKPGVQFFEGRDGFAEALDDSLSATEIIYTIADIDAVEAHAKDINAAYVKKRVAKNIAKKILAFDTPSARTLLKKLTALTEARFLPVALKPFHTGVEIYNGKISFFTLRPENSIAMIVADPDIYAMQRALFEFLWSIAEPIDAARSAAPAASHTPPPPAPVPGLTAFQSD